MPPRPSLAARRFYRTFYHWTNLTQEVHSIAGRHAFHSTSRTSDADQDANRSLVRKHYTVAPRSSGGGNEKRTSESKQQNGEFTMIRKRRQRGSGSGSTPGPKKTNASIERRANLLNESPVLSPSEKAFSSFEPRERVVRYRSPEGLMLEFAMPHVGLQKARATYGHDLERVSQRSGARVEAQNISASVGPRPEDRIHSVLISGTFAQVDTATQFLFSQLPKFLQAVRSQEDAPSALMSPWKLLLRHREGSQIAVELSLPEDKWSSIVGVRDWAKVAMDLGIGMELGLPEWRPALSNPDQMAFARSLVLKGEEDAVLRFRGTLTSLAADSKSRMTAQNAPASSVGTAAITHDTACPRTDGESLKFRLTVCGSNAQKTTFVDAIWSNIERLPPNVRVFRTDMTKQINIGEWYIDIIGPAAAATAVWKQTKTLIEDIGRRMALKHLRVITKRTPNYRYTLALIGKDTASNRLKLSQSIPWTELRGRFQSKLVNQEFDGNGEGWHITFKVQPKYIDQIHERILECIREVDPDVRTTLTLDTLDIELHTAEPTGGTVDQSIIGNKELGASPQLGSAQGNKASLQSRSEAHAAEQLQGVEQTSDVQPQRAGSPAANSISLPVDSLGGKSEEAEKHQSSRTPEQQKLAQDVRSSLRSLTHPVVLITSYVNDAKKQLSPDESARGVTVSSFNTVTLDTQPIVSFNIRVPSRTWDAISHSGKLSVHLLEASSRGAAVAHVFTKPYDRPEMGFEELRKMGLQVQIDSSGQAPIVSDEQGAVLARFEADLLPEKCMTVGDHVVVLAEVKNVASEVHGGGDTDGLAYARRGYRARGDEIRPAEALDIIEGGPNDPLALAAEEPTAQSYTPSAKAADAQQTSDPYASFNLDHDPIFNALRATKDAADSGQDVDIYAAMAMGDEGAGDGVWPSDEKMSRAKPTSGNRSAKKSSSAGKSFSTRSSPSGNSAYPTIHRTPSSERSFSSTATAHRKDEDDASVMDPAAKEILVADYFGVPDDNKRPHTPRVRSLLRLQKDIGIAQRRLENEELDEEETVRLQNSVAHLERIIARKLAWNAASDLRLMLDKGNARVDFKRAQWLESAIEKGLQVLLEDARKLRHKREEGKVDAEQYEMLRQKLEGDHGVLQTEVMRLREVADEDQDGGD